MHDTARLEEIAVTVHEKRSCKSLLLTTNLRVGKCDPYFRHLTRSENGLDELDTGTQECNILQSVFLCILGTLP